MPEGSGFFREYWAEQREDICNVGRDRVNDPLVSTDPNWRDREEARANGLILINLPERLPHLRRVELYLEMWGGHPGTARKRFYVNGRGPYRVPDDGAAAGQCAYTYPVVGLPLNHLVTGVNAIQFACERGSASWGHFIIDNACLRAHYGPDHPEVAAKKLKRLDACVTAPRTLGDKAPVGLRGALAAMAREVSYYGRYAGYAENGASHVGPHGYTFARRPAGNIATAGSAPFAAEWDTSMIPSQSGALALRAVVALEEGLFFATRATEGLRFSKSRPEVREFYCRPLPKPFWSRANQLVKAHLRLPQRLRNVERAQLEVRIWDGGEGGVSEPFRLNGRPYSITSGRASHNVVHTRAAVDAGHLVGGRNEFTLLSDTDHHGIEVLRPGPCITLRMHTPRRQ